MKLSTNQSNILKQTPFYNIHKELGARLVPFAGYEMPVQYSGIKEEHLAVRNDAGIFDVSHMGEFIVEGAGSLDFVNYLLTNKITTEKRATYTLMCNKNGGVVDDLLIYTLDDNKFLLVVNASNIEKDFMWIKQIAQELNFKGKIENLSETYYQLAIQGPNSLDYFRKSFGDKVYIELKEIKFFRYKYINLLGTEVLISRTGYTGEYGFELYGKGDGSNIFKILVDTGLKPCGLGARDSLRLEASLPLYGNEIDEDINPLEAKLGFFIKFDKDFCGKVALEKKVKTRELIGFTINTDERKPIPRHGYSLICSGLQCGTVTSGAMSYILDEPIGMAYIETDNLENISIDIRGKLYPIRVIKLPFIKKKK